MIQAVDADKPNTKNSQIRYEIISGNYDKKFRIDEITGVLSVIEPLGVYPTLDYDSTSKADYVDADMRTSQLHSSGLRYHFLINYIKNDSSDSWDFLFIIYIFAFRIAWWVSTFR